MKIILSHDVDHISVWEHRKDMLIPKHIMRSAIEFSLNFITFSEVVKRLNDIIKNKWNNLDELIKYDKANDIPSTFFFGVRNGMLLTYPLSDVNYWATKVFREGLNAGVHGISFDDLTEIRKEYNSFAEITKKNKIGIRMHYLRSNKKTLANLAEAGYQFDSSLPILRAPFKISNLWEFPLHIMDGNILSRNGHWQDQTLEQAKIHTEKIISKGLKLDLKYLTILFHDRYFSDSFITWKKWYMWTIEYLQLNRFEFISFDDAVLELEKVHS
ncbi:MAG: hypothetical protein M0Z52_09310 [Actinomycetota bacterium]|nr:hypothetical protein [Actinomycetota bacterium]